MEFALDRWITKHNAWIDVFVPNYMRWIFHDVLMESIGRIIVSIVMLCKVTFSCMMNPVESFLLLTWMVTKL